MTNGTNEPDGPPGDIEAYLVGLYGPTPKGLLWIGGHADGWRGKTFASADAAARYAVGLDSQGGQGVYHRSTTLAYVPDKRGTAADTATVHYFALDIDVAGPGHKAENLPATLVDAVRLVEKAGFPAPTVWIHSGGGFYPQWRFTEPIDVRKALVREWVTKAFAAMAEHFITVAGEMGWHLDNVRDLARVYRLPGTTNRKAGAEVIATAVDGSGEKFDLGALASIAYKARESAPGAATAPVGDGEALFDEVKDERRFTRDQGIAFIKAERDKLGKTRSGYNAAVNAFAMACAHFPWLVDRERCGRLMIKTLGPVTGWSAPDSADIATINSAYSATEDGRSWTAVQTDTAPAATGAAGEERTADVILPPPSWPLAVARALLPSIPASQDVLHRAWWRDDFYTWCGTHWDKEAKSETERWLYGQTGDAVYLVPPKKEGDDFVRTPWAPTQHKIANLAHALGVGLLQHTGDEDRVMAVANGVLRGRDLEPHTPAVFNLSSLPFAYDPGAGCPQWLAFLESTLPGDLEAHRTIAEWFGYVLSGRTDLHKIGVLVGPRRCGKGTISRVLEAMVGADGWAAPTLARLGANFGLESMIGKSLAVMGDVRWTSKHVIEAVPVMLGISGEDGFTVDRKNREAWIGKLGTRLLLMSNDAPTFTDASGALAGRMVYVAFRRSFQGREDLSLEGRLMTELPGILNWALDGLDALTARGSFTQSATSVELSEDVDRDSSPVAAWVDDRCVLDPDATFTLDALLSSYKDWLTAEHLAFSPSLNRLSRELRSAFGDQKVTIERKSNGQGGKHRVVTGIRPLAGASIPDGDLFD